MLLSFVLAFIETHTHTYIYRPLDHASDGRSIYNCRSFIHSLENIDKEQEEKKIYKKKRKRSELDKKKQRKTLKALNKISTQQKKRRRKR